MFICGFALFAGLCSLGWLVVCCLLICLFDGLFTLWVYVLIVILFVGCCSLCLLLGLIVLWWMCLWFVCCFVCCFFAVVWFNNCLCLLLVWCFVHVGFGLIIADCLILCCARLFCLRLFWLFTFDGVMFVLVFCLC